MRRFRVVEDSMRPALVPGEELVVSERVPPTVGDVVALPHPARHDFWLVKRMTAGPGDVVPGRGRLGAGRAWVSSDNPEAGAVDSRAFGDVDFASLLPMVRSLDAGTFHEGVELLAAEDPDLGRAVEEHGVPAFWARPPGLPTLVWLILEQQVSLESGAAVFRRVLETAGDMTAEAIVALGAAGLRAAGTTRQKAGYLIGLAEAVVAGSLDLDSLAAMEDGRAREALLSIRGVGPWTADAYLLSALRYPDVFPVGDRALQVGAADVLGLAAVPSPDQLEFLSAPWRPVRAVAARIIWHAYLARRGRAEPLDPRHASGPSA